MAKYIYEVYRCSSFSEAAKKLYISQPALSAAIKKTEKELGYAIFNRKTLPLHLTDEGKVYIAAVERMMQIEQSTIDHIQSIRQSRSGTLKIATSTFLAYYVMPKILRKFRSHSPQVEVNIIPSSTDQLYDLLDKKVADVAFIASDSVPENYTAVNLIQQTFLVAMHSSRPECQALAPYALTHHQVVTGDYPAEKRIQDMTLFQNCEFIYSPPNSSTAKKRRVLFGKTNIAPHITTAANRQQLYYNLMRAGFGAFLTTDANVATQPEDPNCLYFILDDPAARQDFSIVCPKGEEEHPIVKAFIQDGISLFHVEKPLTQLMR